MGRSPRVINSQGYAVRMEGLAPTFCAANSDGTGQREFPREGISGYHWWHG
jgi:hypothetical protein